MGNKNRILEIRNGLSYTSDWECHPNSPLVIYIRGYFFRHSSSMPQLVVITRENGNGTIFQYAPVGVDKVGYANWLDSLRNEY